MQKVLRITGAVSAASSTIQLPLASRRPVLVDAVSAYLSAVPTGAGVQPATEDELRRLERQVRIRLAKDPQLTQLVTPQAVPICAWTSNQTGPVPIEPFLVGMSDQTTVEVEVDANTLLTAPFVLGAGSSINLYVLLWGTEQDATA
jgi:hypothetical protein